MQFDKWYLDFQNGEMFGYYYVSILHVGGLRFTFTEAHHLGPKYFCLNSFQSKWGVQSSARCISTSKLNLSLEKDRTSLSMNLKEGRINASWNRLSKALPQIKGPLFRNGYGQCFWKVWSPKSDVVVDFQIPGGQAVEVRGTGYVDFTRLSIPFWKIPFEALYWGRLYADDGEWIVVFQLQTASDQMVFFANKDGWHHLTKPFIRRHESRMAHRLNWKIGEDTLKIIPVDKIQADMILNKQRLSWLPNGLRRKLSRGGFEKKYLVTSTFREKQFYGIVEEVLWNE